MSIEAHPVLPLVAGALLVPFFGVAGRRVLALLAPAAALGLVMLLPDGAHHSIDLLGREWVLLRMNAMARVFAFAFALYGLLAGLYAWRERGRWDRVAWLGTTAGGIGVVLAGDLLTLLLFWELLTATSLFLIWFGGRPDSLAAGFRYVLFHMAGGLFLLGGAVMLLPEQNAAVVPLGLDGAAGWLILIGLLTNAAIPPLHAWLPDAYPRSTPYGSVFLSAFTTKSAVFVLAQTFPGTSLLVWLGAAAALYGMIFALMENDIRRALIYSILSQVGYMVCGVGLGGDLALNGVTAHAFCHIFYKGLLLMAVGSVIIATGRQKLTELGGLAGPLRWVFALYLVGAFSISAVPLFSGFISKSMIISASAESAGGTAELLLEIASVGTFLYTSLRLPWLIFLTPARSEYEHQPIPATMYVAMGLGAALCIGLGVYPALLYNHLPYPVSYHPYSMDHVLGTLQLLVGTVFGFWLLRAILRPAPTITLDLDRLYRVPIRSAVEGLGAMMEGLGRGTERLRLTAWGARRAPLAQYRAIVRHVPLAEQVMVILIALAGLAYVAFYLYR